MAIRTLNHIYVVDRIFRAHLLCQKHGHTATNTPDIPDTPDLSVIHFAVAKTDIWFERYVPGMGERELGGDLVFLFTDGVTGTMTREEMLFHVFTHGSYHCGNLGQILKDIAVTPPRDLRTKFWHVRELLRQNA